MNVPYDFFRNRVRSKPKSDSAMSDTRTMPVQMPLEHTQVEFTLAVLLAGARSNADIISNHPQGVDSSRLLQKHLSHSCRIACSTNRLCVDLHATSLQPSITTDTETNSACRDSEMGVATFRPSISRRPSPGFSVRHCKSEILTCPASLQGPLPSLLDLLLPAPSSDHDMALCFSFWAKLHIFVAREDTHLSSDICFVIASTHLQTSVASSMLGSICQHRFSDGFPLAVSILPVEEKQV